MIPLTTLTEYLDNYLNVAGVADDRRALNGLQVENSGSVARVAAAVDACQAAIDGAAAVGADFLLVHHGLFWAGLEPIVGRHARRVRALLEHDIALYGAHIPLDCHPDVGNNAVLARDLGLRNAEWIGDYDGVSICVAGDLETTRDALVVRLAERLHTTPHVVATGPDAVRRVAIVTGAGSSMLAAAREAGVDTFITGEGPHHVYFDAEESGMNLILAGHYATETVGVQELARHLEEKFGLSWSFIDHPTGM